MTIYKILYTTTFDPEVSVMAEFTSRQDAERQMELLADWLDPAEIIWLDTETL